MKKIIWRLKEQPTTVKLQQLVMSGILTKDEAREILFFLSNEDLHSVYEGRSEENLQSEIKFLRELVEKLSKGRTDIVETIRYIEKPYYQSPWWKPYEVWCSDGTGIYGTDTATTKNCFSSIDTF